MGARPRSRGCGTSAVPSPGRPPGRGLRRSGELATRLALPAGGRSAKPRAGVPVPTHQRPRPSLPSLPPGSTGCPARRAASYSRSSAAPATQPGAAAGEPAARCPSFARKLSPLAAPRPCARASGAPTAARVSRRPGEAGPAPRRRAPAAPALAAPPPRVGSPSSRLPHSRRPRPFPSWPAPLPPLLGWWRRRVDSGRLRLGGLGGGPHLSGHAATQQRHPASL